MQIRLNEVYDQVDQIVLVESAVTHQDSPKPLHYKENRARYARFADKIIHIVLNTLHGPNSFYKCADSPSKHPFFLFPRAQMTVSQLIPEHAYPQHEETCRFIHEGALRCDGHATGWQTCHCREWYHREMLFEKGLKYPGKEVKMGDLIMSGV